MFKCLCKYVSVTWGKYLGVCEELTSLINTQDFLSKMLLTSALSENNENTFKILQAKFTQVVSRSIFVVFNIFFTFHRSLTCRFALKLSFQFNQHANL